MKLWNPTHNSNCFIKVTTYYYYLTKFTTNSNNLYNIAQRRKVLFKQMKSMYLMNIKEEERKINPVNYDYNHNFNQFKLI